MFLSLRIILEGNLTEKKIVKSDCGSLSRETYGQGYTEFPKLSSLIFYESH